MSINNHETSSNSSSPFVFVHGGAGVGWMWQPHIAQLTDFHSPVFDLSRHSQAGKKAAVVQVNNIKERLPIPRRAQPRKMEQCRNNICLAAS